MSDAQTGDDPDLIWHYTDGSGLLGILTPERPHIYATDALYLNDTRELIIALEHQIPLMKTIIPADDDLVGEHSVARLYKSWVGDWLEHVEPPEGIYVTSFSRNGDLLSQWRGYGTAAGYALGVSRSELAASLGVGDHLVDVQYGAPDGDFLNNLRPQSLQIGERLTFDANPVAVATLKDPSFAEEQEVRIIGAAGGREVHFRGSPYGLIPFLKIDLPLTCLKSVRLGPGLGGSNSVRAVERFAERIGLSGLEVRTSSVPYRV